METQAHHGPRPDPGDQVIHGGGGTPEYMIDQVTLREYCLDEQATRQWCRHNPDHPLVVPHLRILGETALALQAGRRQLHARTPGSTGWAAAAVRVTDGNGPGSSVHTEADPSTRSADR